MYVGVVERHMNRRMVPGTGGGKEVLSRQLAARFMEHLRNAEDFGYMAVSLGYSETPMSASAASTSSEMDDESLAKAGIPRGLVRMSIGYSGDLDERLAQLERGYRKAMA